jgi:filamentous hemagglutinin family protein
VTNANGTIINWNSFNIGAGNTVRFNQASSTSRVLNRVTGGNPSQIAGTLSSNGIVYLTNSAGIFIANGAVINVAGFAAAAGSISNTDFITGNNHFTNVTGTVENRGTIEAASAHLIGQRVANYGAINAPNGMVTMTAGSDVYIGEQGGQIYARVEGAPAAGGTGVTQAGRDQCSGRAGPSRRRRHVCRRHRPSRSYRREEDHPPGRQGQRRSQHGRRLRLGTLDASDYSAGGHGGEIKVLGDRVGVFGAGVH